MKKFKGLLIINCIRFLSKNIPNLCINNDFFHRNRSLNIYEIKFYKTIFENNSVSLIEHMNEILLNF